MTKEEKLDVVVRLLARQGQELAARHNETRWLFELNALLQKQISAVRDRLDALETTIKTNHKPKREKGGAA